MKTHKYNIWDKLYYVGGRKDGHIAITPFIVDGIQIYEWWVKYYWCKIWWTITCAESDVYDSFDDTVNQLRYDLWMIMVKISDNL
jgi:hypothetical protein